MLDIPIQVNREQTSFIHKPSSPIQNIYQIKHTHGGSARHAEQACWYWLDTIHGTTKMVGWALHVSIKGMA